MTLNWKIGTEDEGPKSDQPGKSQGARDFHISASSSNDPDDNPPARLQLYSLISQRDSMVNVMSAESSRRIAEDARIDSRT